mgnify:CR=1 FL=1
MPRTFTDSGPEWPSSDDESRTYADRAECYGPWMQRVTWPDGSVSGEWDRTARFVKLLGSYEPRGKTLLDVGSMSGLMTHWFECLGAHVTACEVDPVCFPQFEFLRAAFGLEAVCHNKSVYDVADLGRFGVVWMTGVYYHLQHPLLGLQRAWGVCGEVLFVEGEVMPGEGNVCSFWPGEYKGDGSNWWVPTVDCLYSWLTTLPGVGSIDMIYPMEADHRAGARVWRQ